MRIKYLTYLILILLISLFISSCKKAEIEKPLEYEVTVRGTIGVFSSDLIEKDAIVQFKSNGDIIGATITNSKGFYKLKMTVNAGHQNFSINIIPQISNYIHQLKDVNGSILDNNFSLKESEHHIDVEMLADAFLKVKLVDSATVHSYRHGSVFTGSTYDTRLIRFYSHGSTHYELVFNVPGGLEEQLISELNDDNLNIIKSDTIPIQLKPFERKTILIGY